MIERKWLEIVLQRLSEFSAVGLLGARQVGKTTLALEIANHQSILYLDLENYQDLAKLQDPVGYLNQHKDKLVILDEIQRVPELFASLRSLIDQRRREGNKFGQYLILGSASLDLLRQSSESLAGRISYIEMSPLSALEVHEKDLRKLWLRGGYPDSYLAGSESASLNWRDAFIETYLEREIPQFGPRITAETLRRLWIMLAHVQGSPLNASQLATNLNISGQTVGRYIDLLVDLFLVRKVLPLHSNVGKRLVKAPKVYVRDSGITHALLNINDFEELITHPIVGMSYEGFVIDNILSQLPPNAQSYYYRTARGAEIDLVIDLPDKRRLAIEIKTSSAPKLRKGFFEVSKDVNPTHSYVIYQGEERYPIEKNIEAISLRDFLNELIKKN